MGIVTRLWTGRYGVRIPVEARELSPSKHPRRLSGVLSLIFSRLRCSFPGIVKLTTHLHLMLSWRGGENLYLSVVLRYV